MWTVPPKDSILNFIVINFKSYLWLMATVLGSTVKEGLHLSLHMHNSTRGYVCAHARMRARQVTLSVRAVVVAEPRCAAPPVSCGLGPECGCRVCAGQEGRGTKGPLYHIPTSSPPPR